MAKRVGETTLITGRHVKTGAIARRQWDQARGFTLLELVLVMVLVSLVMGLAAPSLRAFVLGRKSADAAAQVLALCQYAHDQAVGTGSTYRFNVDTSAGAYWLTVQKGAEFRELGTEFGRRFNLPERVEAAWLSHSGAGFQTTSQSGTGRAPAPQLHDYIDFFPDGRTEATNLQLSDRDGQTFEIGCLSETEPLIVLQKGGR
jgi:prepilin-type N-terminal cleavage/methylation domain-containing protein